MFSLTRQTVLIASTTAILALAATVGAEEPAPRRDTSRFEIRFLIDMIDHHMMAVMTAELCLDRTRHGELEALCEQIKQVQLAEIREMQSWLSDWYGIRYEPRMKGGMRRQLRELAKLQNAKFEIAFMQMMIVHHSEAIEEGEECVERAFHDDLVELCEGIVATQSMEIELMEAWLCDWYSICD